jgi:DNA-binding transcriptional MerR regulator
MRIGELSRRSEVPIPTIKYYLREGLLPPGRTTGRNQADYADTHLARLMIIRTLLRFSGLGLADIGQLLDDIDTPGPDVPAALCRLVGSGPAGTSPDDLTRDTVTSVVEKIVRRHGWAVPPDDPVFQDLADRVAVLRRLGLDVGAEALDGYARAAAESVAAEQRMTTSGAPAQQAVAAFLGDGLLTSMRRLAARGWAA